MFCPSCGERTTAEQKFCRACGTKLEKVWEALAEQSAIGDQMAAETNAALEARTRWLERLRDVAFYIFMLMLGGGILWGVVYVIMIRKGAVLSGLAFLIFLIAALATVFLSAHLDERKGIKKKRGATPPATLSESEPTARLLHESRIEPIPSVIDHTTELLKVERPARDTREV